MAEKSLTIQDEVADRIRILQTSGELILPPNYCPGNALKSAWFQILEAVDKDKKPALEVCTRESVANALLKMVVYGLNPIKNQCYFIVRKNKLYCDRSYFGSIALAKMVDNTIAEVNANVVYEGDVFEYAVNSKGRKEIVRHVPELKNIDKKKIVAAYAVIVDTNDNVKTCAIKTYDEIVEAWKQSPMYVVNDNNTLKTGSVHAKFTADMAMKTVVNFVLKPIINGSDDKGLLGKLLKEESIEQTDDEIFDTVKDANTIVIDKSTGEIIEGVGF
jgi:recombination protein RecT